MRTRLTTGVLALAAAAALVAAGCGGNGGGGGERLSAAEFRTQADAICAEYDEKIEALGQPESLDDLTEFIDRAIPIIEEGFAKLRALEPPEDLEADWDRAMQLNEDNLALTRELRDAAEKNDQERVQQALTQASENEDETDQLAEDLGLERCGQESGES